MGCEYLIFMFPTALTSVERQRKKTQITDFSFSKVAMIQIIGSSECIYESHLKELTLQQKDRFHQMPHSDKGLWWFIW